MYEIVNAIIFHIKIGMTLLFPFPDTSYDCNYNVKLPNAM